MAGTWLLPYSARAEDPEALLWARVDYIRNRVELVPQDQNRRRARISDVLSVGDALRTARASRAELRFNDGSQARVGERAIFQFTPNTRNFQLSNGTILLLIPPGRGRSTIQTPNATTGIQGSALFVRYIPETDTTIVGALTNNPEGPMVLFNRDGTEQQALRANEIGVIQGDQITELYEFDGTLFWQSSGLAEGFNYLSDTSSSSNPDQLDGVREEIREAISTQGRLSGESVITNPETFSAPAGESGVIEDVEPAKVEFDNSPAEEYLEGDIDATDESALEVGVNNSLSVSETEDDSAEGAGDESAANSAPVGNEPDASENNDSGNAETGSTETDGTEAAGGPTGNSESGAASGGESAGASTPTEDAANSGSGPDAGGTVTVETNEAGGAEAAAQGTSDSATGDLTTTGADGADIPGTDEPGVGTTPPTAGLDGGDALNGDVDAGNVDAGNVDAGNIAPGDVNTSGDSTSSVPESGASSSAETPLSGAPQATEIEGTTTERATGGEIGSAVGQAASQANQAASQVANQAADQAAASQSASGELAISAEVMETRIEVIDNPATEVPTATTVQPTENIPGDIVPGEPTGATITDSVVDVSTTDAAAAATEIITIPEGDLPITQPVPDTIEKLDEVQPVHDIEMHDPSGSMSGNGMSGNGMP